MTGGRESHMMYICNDLINNDIPNKGWRIASACSLLNSLQYWGLSIPNSPEFSRNPMGSALPKLFLRWEPWGLTNIDSLLEVSWSVMVAEWNVDPGLSGLRVLLNPDKQGFLWWCQDCKQLCGNAVWEEGRHPSEEIPVRGTHTANEGPCKSYGGLLVVFLGDDP